MVSRNEYYKEWYARNKDRRNAKRRARYENDPVYAEVCRKRSKAYRDGVEMDDSILDELGSYYVYVDGEPKPANTVADLAKKVGKGPATVYKWIRCGVLPETPFQSPRLYTDQMVEVVRRAVDARGRVKSNDVSFREEVEAEWEVPSIEG